MARGPEGVRLRIEEICSKFYGEITFIRRGRYQRFTDCRCCGCTCGCCAESQRRSIGKPAMCRSVSCGDSQYHDKDGVSRPAPSLMRKIYPREERANKRIPEMSTSASPASRDDYYEGVKNPYILLINNVNFHTMPAPRGGAVADIQNLLEFFRGSGFKSIVDRYDLLQDQMRAILEDTRTNPDLVDHDAFICVIMTHGDAEGLKGVDDWHENSIKVERITSMFTGDKCPQLMTKPKLFFIQACRGEEEDKGSVLVPRGQSGPGSWVTDNADEKEMVVKLPSEADILVAYSTTKYHVSYRKLTDNVRAMVEQRKTMGSWFISCMVQVFNAYSHTEDLMTMMAKVNRAMTQLYTGGDPASGNKQISCQLSMLTKKLYFAKYWEQRRHHR